MTEKKYNGNQIAAITTEAESINDYNSIRFWVDGKEVDAKEVKMVVYVEDIELERPCIYCNKNESTHFLCESCGAGMCNECYETNEHTSHYNKPLEECEVKHIDLIKKVCNSDDPQYICEKCMKKALSLTPQDFAQTANDILKQTDYKAVIIETSELYGADDEDIKEDDLYYLQPMYEGYIEDSQEDEIEDTRTGRYCSLLSVSEELESFASECKITYIKRELEKLVHTRWKDKEHLQKHLQETYGLTSTLTDVDESGLTSDYAFIMGIFENFGYIDIYYLKVPFDENTIYITGVTVMAE